jgi:hypothetical protein
MNDGSEITTLRAATTTWLHAQRQRRCIRIQLDYKHACALATRATRVEGRQPA